MAKEINLENEIAALKEDFAKLREDIMALTNAGMEQGKSVYGDAKERLLEQGHKSSEYITTMMAERPVVTVFTAFGLGVVLAKLFCHK